MVVAAPLLSNATIITVKDQRISPQVLLEDLQVWDMEGWDWQVHHLSDFEFAAVFPSKESLKMISSCTRFTLPLNQLVVSVKAATSGSKSVGPMSIVWVLVDDMPASLWSSPFLVVGVKTGGSRVGGPDLCV